MLKRFLTTVLLLIIVLTFGACSGDDESQTAVSPVAPGTAHTIPVAEALSELPPIWDVPVNEPTTIAEEITTTELLQLSPLTPGELLVTMHTSAGDIILRFFPTEAPMAVENFLTHAWNGYYDGVIFHRVINNFMMQGGCPQGSGMGGESIWGGTFGYETSPNLRHFRGALAMAQTSMPESIGSQFYIVQNYELAPSVRAHFIEFLEMQDEVWENPDGSVVRLGDVFTEESLHYFLDNGGTPMLDWHLGELPYTVFGHVVSGMDVVDAITSAQTGENDRPIEPVTMDSFTFFLYQGGAS